MLLNELVKEYSIRTVSDKTNISENSLQKLINKEWSKMKEPQVIGFLRIIEREYGLDLKGLEEEARAYYKEHKAKENHNPIDIVGAAEVKSESKIVSGFVTFVTLAVVAYATWYYVQDYNKKSMPAVESNNSSHGMFESTLKSVKSILGFSSTGTKVLLNDTNETNNSVAVEANRTNVHQESQKQIVTTPKEQPKNEAPKAIVQEHKKFDLTTVTNEETNDSSNELSTEENSTTQEKAFAVGEEKNRSPLEESNSTDEVVSQENSTLNETAESITESNISDENIIAQENNISESNKSQEESNSMQNVTPISEITITPLSARLWLGIYNLDTHKRVNKFITSEIKLPIDGNYAIITGHNKLEISGDSFAVMRFPQRGRVYLLVSPKGIKKIDAQEYKSVTKNRAW